MVIIITLPEFFEGEAEIITQFLLEGQADMIHLRKPSSTAEELEGLIKQIPEEWHSRLVTHDHHHLAEQYSLHGIHLNGRNPEIPSGFQYSSIQRGYIIKGNCTLSVSRSCHSFEEVKDWKDRCCYVSLSPIYDSISKKGYHSAFTVADLRHAHEEGIIDERVLALGGVTFDKIDEILDLGFGGGMILGEAWK